MKPSPADKFADVMFPLNGISLSDSFGEQQPDTTPLGVNVRTFEAMLQRARGGSRPGLSKYLSAQLPNGAHLIQHLNIIVDPQGGATLDNDDGDFADPSTPGDPSSWGVTQNSRIHGLGRQVRRGGSGRMMFKNMKRVLTVTANDISKSSGATYTFDGSEFSAAGLGIADAITGMTFASAGAGAGAPDGSYPIVASAAVIVGPGKGSYKIKYVNGTMTVGAAMVAGIKYIFFDGDHTWGVTVCPPATTGTAERCSGDNSTVAASIANGYLVSQSPTVGPPGISCGI